MDFIEFPKFLRDRKENNIFRQLDAFVNMSRQLKYIHESMTITNDDVVDMLREITRFPPLEEIPQLNGLFHLVRDMCFEINYQPKSSELPTIEYNKLFHEPIESKMFFRDKGVKDEVEKLHRAIQKHKVLYNRVRFSQLDFISLVEDANELACLHKQALHKMKGPVSDTEDDQPEPTPRYQRTMLRFMQRQRKVDQKVEAAYLRFQTQKSEEFAHRNDVLLPMYYRLRTVVEGEMRHALSDALRCLLTVTVKMDLSRRLRDRIKRVDAEHLATRIYEKLSLNYAFSFPENYAMQEPIPVHFEKKPNIALEKKRKISVVLTEHIPNSRLIQRSRISQKLANFTETIAFGTRQKLFSFTKEYIIYETKETVLKKY